MEFIRKGPHAGRWQDWRRPGNCIQAADGIHTQAGGRIQADVIHTQAVHCRWRWPESCSQTADASHTGSGAHGTN